MLLELLKIKISKAVNKILIIRYSSIGDVILTSPVVRCIKQQTNAEIHILTKSNFASLFESNPHVTKVHLSNEQSFSKMIKNLKNENFDLIVDLHKNAKSLLTRFFLWRPAISFDKLNFRKWLFVLFKINKLPQNIHLVDRYFQSLKKINITNDDIGLEYFYKSNFIPPRLEALNSKYCVGVLGAAHNTKMIPIEKWNQWIPQLPYPILLVGGKKEELIQATLTQLHKNVIPIGKFKTLDDTAHFIQHAEFVITPDTGMMHLAAAFQKKILAIWGNTTPSFGMYPYFGKNKSQYISSEVNELNCRPCSKLGYNKCPKGHHSCMLKQPNELSSLIKKITGL